MEYHGELGAKACQLPWSTGAENWYGEVVWKPGSLHGVLWRARVETWQLPWSLMDSAVWVLDILMEYHEKVGVVGNRHTSGVLLGLSVDPWSISIQRMRPTVYVNLSSGH